MRNVNVFKLWYKMLRKFTADTKTFWKKFNDLLERYVSCWLLTAKIEFVRWIGDENPVRCRDCVDKAKMSFQKCKQVDAVEFYLAK